MGDLLLYAIRFVGMAAVVVTGLFFVTAKTRTLITYIVVGICASVLAYLLVGTTFLSIDARLRLNFGAFNTVLIVTVSCAPWLLMLLSRYMFSVYTGIPLWSVFLLALQLGLDLVVSDTFKGTCQTANCMSIPPQGILSVAFLIFALPTIIKLWFCFMAFIWAIKDWSLDLSALHRCSRLVFIGLLVILGGGIFAAEDFTLNFMLPLFPLVSTIDTVLISVYFTGLVICLLYFRGGDTVEQLVLLDESSS